MSTKFRNINDQPKGLYPEIEYKLKLIIEHLAGNIEGGVKMLPHDQTCQIRRKRGIDEEEDPVNTLSAFPAVGKLFSWVTGTLSSDAGRYINQNFHNIKRLTRMSVKFAQMFNHTLNIEKKHSKQLMQIHNEVASIHQKLDSKLSGMEKRNAYETFLQNTAIIVTDLQRTVDQIFQHTDAAENNNMGPLARDPIFVSEVAKLMYHGAVNSKRNILYLTKISSRIDVEACGLKLQIIYRFPVLKRPNYVPFKTIAVPKQITGKFYQLSNLPYMITWNRDVFVFTEDEYRNCIRKNRHIFCEMPGKGQPLVENCLYGMINKIPWNIMGRNCPLTEVLKPEKFIKITESHLIYFKASNDLVTLICPEGQEVRTKTITLEGAGVVTIPTGCRISFEDKKTVSIGYINRESDIMLNLDEEVWRTNMSHILQHLNVKTNTENSTLWAEDNRDEKFIEQGLIDSWEILNYMQFTPSQVTFTLCSIILYTVVITIMMIVLFILVCRPNCCRTCSRNCCCSKPKHEMRAPGNNVA